MPSSSAATSSFSLGCERRHVVGGALGPRCRSASSLRLDAPPTSPSTVSQPSPAASSRAAARTSSVPRRGAVQHHVPGAVAEQAALLALGDDGHAGARVDAHAHEHAALDRGRGVRAAPARRAGRRSRPASAQKRASSSSSVSPARCPRSLLVGVFARHRSGLLAARRASPRRWPASLLVSAARNAMSSAVGS